LKLISVAPDIIIFELYSISKFPPGKETTILLLLNLLIYAATAVAHAAVPHASVFPAPRSHTLILICVSDITWQ